MTFGPSEAFTPEQLAELYDVNVLSTQRVNRAALPHMRKRRDGLLLWISFQQHTRRHALRGTVLRRESGDGLTRGDLCR